MPSGNTTQPLEPISTDSGGRLDPSPIGSPSLQSPWAVRLITKEEAIPIHLRVDDRAFIGRADPDSNYHPEIDLTPLQALQNGVSRHHAEIRAGAEYLVIIDLASTNGTKLNNFRLQPREPYRLRHGDLLTIGTLEFEVQIAIMPIHGGIKVVKKTGTGLLGNSGFRKGNSEHTHRRILVVEDDHDTAETFARMLATLGYEAHMVHRTGDAMRFIATEIPDAIFLDLNMPDHPAIEVCRMMKSDLGNVHVPIFVISGETDEQKIKAAFDAGADVFLSKPIGMDELLESLEKFVGEPSK